MKKKITQVLRNLAVPPHVLGYEYLRTAILLCVEDSKLIHRVKKDLYPQIAEQYETTSSRVERAIRHAIQISVFNVPLDELTEYIFVPTNSMKQPTNAEYIASIADVIRLDMEE